jgi:hypothetical protein
MSSSQLNLTPATSDIYSKFVKSLLSVPSRDIDCGSSAPNNIQTFYFQQNYIQINKESYDLVIKSGAQIFGGFARDIVAQILKTGEIEMFTVYDVDVYLSNTTSLNFKKTVFAFVDLLAKMDFKWINIEDKSSNEGYSVIHITFQFDKFILKVDFVRRPGILDFDVNGLVITKWKDQMEPSFELRNNLANLKIGEVLKNIKKKKFRIAHIDPGSNKHNILSTLKLLARVIKMKNRQFKVIKEDDYKKYTSIIKKSESEKYVFELVCQEGCCKQFNADEFIEKYEKEHDEFSERNVKNKYWTCSPHDIQTLLPWFQKE